MIASLPMYDWPEVREATDLWWNGIARHLKTAISLSRDDGLCGTLAARRPVVQPDLRLSVHACAGWQGTTRRHAALCASMVVMARTIRRIDLRPRNGSSRRVSRHRRRRQLAGFDVRHAGAEAGVPASGEGRPVLRTRYRERRSHQVFDCGARWQGRCLRRRRDLRGHGQGLSSGCIWPDWSRSPARHASPACRISPGPAIRRQSARP